jgi:perosamine synthetase
MKFQVSQPDIGSLELEYVSKAMESGWISSSGEFLDRFESEFGALTGHRFCIGTSNGTTALHLALLALDIGPGDEVIVPSFTFIAAVNAIKYVGATPVFCDVSPYTWGVSLELVQKLITNQTKAVILVHNYGHPVDFPSICEFLRNKNISIVEDCAESPFSSARGIKVGTQSDIATFSFFGNKVISSGEGGAVVTNKPDLADKVKLLRGQGMDLNKRYYFPVIGYNYRMTNIAAAILCAQLFRLPEILFRRQLVCDRYREVLTSTSRIDFQPIQDWATWTPWLFTILLPSETARNSVASELLKLGIETRPLFIPIHTMPPYADIKIMQPLEFTNKISYSGLNLPTSSKMSTDTVDEISASLKQIRIAE